MDLRAALEITRPANCLLAALGALTGMLLVFPPASPTVWTLVGAPLAVALVAAQGNIRNDLADIELDRKAHPDRPLPSGRLNREEAGALALFLVLVAVPTAWAAGGSAAIAFVLVNVGLLELYERRLKKKGLTGNLAIAYLVASSFVFGALCKTDWVIPSTVELEATIFHRLGGLWLVALLAILAFLTNLGREIAKDVEDEAGDRGRRQTLPMRIGRGPALVVATSAIVLAVVIAQLPLFLQIGPGTSWGRFLALPCAVLLAGCILMWRDARRGQLVLKLGMAGATLASLAFAFFLAWIGSVGSRM